MLRYLRFPCRGVLVVVAFSVTLTGCLDMLTEIHLRRDGSGIATIQYDFDSSLLELGMFDPDDRFLPVPISRADFVMLVEQNDEISLRRYRIRRRDGLSQIWVRLRFENIAALRDFFVPRSIVIDDSGDAMGNSVDERQFSLLLYDPGESALTDPDIANHFLSDYRATFTLRAPSSIVSVNIGEYSGRNATWSATLSELLAHSVPLWWRVSW